ncbi:MAG: calcium/sodium antiporter [Lachnospiraceae bacterium]|nr:calcium/sodium antiporter [Lachnospiraceae bacterium]
MELTMAIILFLVGIVLIVKGGDFFVDAASWIAEISGIPKLIVGATIVSLATTLPEMLVSVMAAAGGEVEMSVGNAVGSVTANIGLIMAISLVCMPAVIKRKDYLVKSILMLAAAGLIVASGLKGEVGIGISALLIVIFLVFMWDNVASALRSMKEEKEGGKRRGWSDAGRKEVLVNFVKFVLGAVGIVGGAQLLVDNGKVLADIARIDERIIGVTIIAVGTSLPELVTTVTAIVKKQSSLSIGNILGANIIDLALIMPISALVSGKALPIDPSSARFDFPACLIAGCIAVIPTMITGRFRKWQGVLLLAVYAVYMFLTCTAGGM